MSISTTELNDGTDIPCLAFGTGTALAQVDCSGEILQAIKNGYYHIDAAQCYGNEEYVGKAIAASPIPREKLYIASKCGTAFDQDDKGNTDVKAELETSLRKLGVSYLDLYLLHSPFINDSIARAWADLEQAQADGLVRSIGVSNYRISDLKELLRTATITPAVNQIEFHPLVHKASKKLVTYCASKGIAIACYGTLATLTREPARGSNTDQMVNDIAAAKGWTDAQVLLKWASKMTYGGVVVTTTNQERRLQEQKQPFIDGELTETELTQISESAGDRFYRHTFLDADKD